ncbi:hypothetical protein [Sphingobacterium detergens]|uniref:Uncharacterized protein n=1 Tax=Sphingobacterium detergens TaxID=1145106 RepID=A0A420BGF3_SPHD1|nr:hypothetical protein [Sphingobacterium detergens]RKE55792.1 hypothetical protein DFQ12_0631 [Sphingobacterium detergens]
MKKYFILLAVVSFIRCSGQNRSDTNEFVNSSDLKGEVWHVGKSRVFNKRGGIIFSNDVYLHFLDKDSIQMTYSRYSPSIGLSTMRTDGIYRVDRKNEVSIVFFEPKDTFGRSRVSIGGTDVQFSLYAMSSVRSPDEPAFDRTTLPQIKTYHFKISNYLTNGDFIAELTLLDDKQVAYNFGTYTFDHNKTAK